MNVFSILKEVKGQLICINIKFYKNFMVSWSIIQEGDNDEAITNNNVCRIGIFINIK